MIDTATFQNYKTVLDRGKATCQEASPHSVNTYIPCGEPASAIVDNGDPSPYFMCEACTYHNVHNRGARLIYSKAKSTAHGGRRVLTKPCQIGATDVRLVQSLEDLGASESAGFVEQREARNESELLRALSAFAESSPRALRGQSSVHVGGCTYLSAVVSVTLTND